MEPPNSILLLNNFFNILSNSSYTYETPGKSEYINSDLNYFFNPYNILC